MVPGEFGHLLEYRGVTGPPGEYMGLIGPYWERGGGGQGGGAPPSPIRIGVGARPPFPSPSLLLPSFPTPTREGGILLPPGVGLPP